MNLGTNELVFILNAVDAVRSQDTRQAHTKGQLLVKLAAELEVIQSGADNGLDSDSPVSDE